MIFLLNFGEPLASSRAEKKTGETKCAHQQKADVEQWEQ